MKIPRRPWVSRWDGKAKLYTRDCEGCNYYRRTDEEEYCGWGKTFKVLSRDIKKLRKCEFKGRKDEGDNSVKYLDEIIIQTK